MSEQITWVCEVCGKAVSKRQSLALPTGGRACKSHENVQATVKAKQLTDNVNAAKKKLVNLKVLENGVKIRTALT